MMSVHIVFWCSISRVISYRSPKNSRTKRRTHRPSEFWAKTAALHPSFTFMTFLRGLTPDSPQTANASHPGLQPNGLHCCSFVQYGAKRNADDDIMTAAEENRRVSVRNRVKETIRREDMEGIKGSMNANTDGEDMEILCETE